MNYSHFFSAPRGIATLGFLLFLLRPHNTLDQAPGERPLRKPRRGARRAATGARRNDALGEGSAAAAVNASECPTRSPGAGKRAQTFATPVSPAGLHGELSQTKASTSETSRALQALTRSKQPHLRCLPSFFSV